MPDDDLGFVDISLPEEDLKGLANVLVFGLLHLDKSPEPWQREAIRVGGEVLSTLRPMILDIEAERCL